MASTIILSDNGVSSGSAGLKQTAGNDGVLILQTTTSGGTATNALTVDNLQNAGLGLTPSSWQSTSKAYEIGSGGTSQGAWGITSSGYMDIFRNAYISSGNAIYKYNGYAQQYRQSVDGSHSWGVAPSGTAGGTISFTQVLAVDKDKTLALQGATSGTGTGITFPATQSASSNANTLDDYEEGTFTPVMSSGSGSITSQTCYGKYTKIGNTVTVVISAAIVTVGSAGGNMFVSGLPFLPVWAGSGRPSVSLVREDSASGYGYMAITGNGQSFFTLFTLSTNVQPPWTSGYQYTFNATYITS